MRMRLALPLALALTVSPLVGCASDPADSSQTQGDRTAIPHYSTAPPHNAAVPAVEGPLESHPGDEEHFYTDTDDYVVWAMPSTHTTADWEYRVVSFNSNGLQSSAFLKYVFSSEAAAQEFATRDDLLVQVGNVVYYKGWFGPEVQDKAGVIEIATANGNEYYIAKP